MTMPLQVDRRTALRWMISAAGAAGVRPAYSMVSTVVDAGLSPWQPGELHIHHIDTGLGNSTLVIAPDGTTLMIDAGGGVPLPTSSPARPDASRRPGEWIGRYAKRVTPAAKLDYFLATHIHPDHVGDVSAESPTVAPGGYRLTGVSDVDAICPITTVIDRAFPDYASHPPAQAAFAQNYIAYLQARREHQKPVEAAQLGSDRQIQLVKEPQRYPSFNVRLLSANGAVWNARDASGLNAPAGKQLPENDLSIALRLQYGRFSYFSGGDLVADTEDGASPWMDHETPTVRACGRVEVAAATHHGYFDACGPAFVQALDAQVYVIPAWDVGHPGSGQMQRLLGDWSGTSKRHDVYATELLPQNAEMNRRFVPHLKGRMGHVVVRVNEGGDTYRVFQVDSTREEGAIVGQSGPYASRPYRTAETTTRSTLTAG